MSFRMKKRERENKLIINTKQYTEKEMKKEN